MRDGNEAHLDRSDLAAAILMERIVRGAYDARKSDEIQPLQWSILRYVDRFPGEHCTLTRIAGYLGLTHAPISRAVARLRKRDMLRIEDHPSDARSQVLRLTEKGTDALNRDPIQKIARRFHTLPDRDRDAMKRSLRALALKLGN